MNKQTTTTRKISTKKVMDWWNGKTRGETEEIKKRCGYLSYAHLSDAQVMEVYYQEHPELIKTESKADYLIWWEGLEREESYKLKDKYFPYGHGLHPLQIETIYKAETKNEGFKKVWELPKPVEEAQRGFTGGNWSYDVIKSEGEIHIISDKTTDVIASIYSEPLEGDNYANARLISNAKNMYEALKEWLKVINRTDAAKHYYGEITEKTEAILNKIDNQ